MASFSRITARSDWVGGVSNALGIVTFFQSSLERLQGACKGQSPLASSKGLGLVLEPCRVNNWVWSDSPTTRGKNCKGLCYMPVSVSRRIKISHFKRNSAIQTTAETLPTLHYCGRQIFRFLGKPHPRTDTPIV